MSNSLSYYVYSPNEMVVSLFTMPLISATMPDASCLSFLYLMIFTSLPTLVRLQQLTFRCLHPDDSVLNAVYSPDKRDGLAYEAHDVRDADERVGFAVHVLDLFTHFCFAVY